MHSSYCSIHFLWPFQRVWWRLLSLLRNQMWSLILIRKSDANLPNHWVCTISCLCNKKWVGRCGVNDFSYWRFAEISWIFEKRHLPFNYWLDCFSLIEHMNALAVAWTIPNCKSICLGATMHNVQSKNYYLQRRSTHANDTNSLLH